MRIEQLTFTRFIAAVMIVVFHFGREAFPFNFDETKTIIGTLNVHVSYFFILSGFVMIIAYHKLPSIHFSEYVKNRFARIYPVFFLAIIFLYLVERVRGNYVYPKEVLINMSLLQAWIPEYVFIFNTPSWSISVEVLFYITFPFLFTYIYKKYKLPYIVVGVFVIWLITQIISNYLFNSIASLPKNSNDHKFLFQFPLFQFSSFLVGNVTALLFISNSNERKNYDWLILLLLLLSIYGMNIEQFAMFKHNGLFALVFAPLIYFMALNNGYITKLFSMKFCIFLGEISYGIYILQKPMYLFTQSFTKRVLHIQNDHLDFYLGLLLLIVVSGFVYIYFEKPMRTKIKQLF